MAPFRTVSLTRCRDDGELGTRSWHICTAQPYCFWVQCLAAHNMPIACYCHIYDTVPGFEILWCRLLLQTSSQWLAVEKSAWQGSCLWVLQKDSGLEHMQLAHHCLRCTLSSMASSHRANPNHNVWERREMWIIHDTILISNIYIYNDIYVYYYYICIYTIYDFIRIHKYK